VKSRIFIMVLVIGVLLVSGCSEKGEETAMQTESPTSNESAPVFIENTQTPSTEEGEVATVYPPPLPVVVEEGEVYPSPNETKDYQHIEMNMDDLLPRASDSQLKQVTVYIDGSEILLMDDKPQQIKLHVWGNLPTPCNELRTLVQDTDDQNRIQVMVYAVTDPNVMCTQVITPFDVSFVIGEFSEGKYTVVLNGEEIGSVDLP